MTHDPMFTKTPSGALVPRRSVLKAGLASFATVMMSRALVGCGGPTQPTPNDGGADAFARDAFAPDAWMPDAGPQYFPVRTVPERPALRSLIADIGELGEPDANGLRLPPGFTSRVIARRGEVVPGTTYEWHIFPDGGATFITEDEGWIYANNSEMIAGMGGVGAVRFDASGEISAAHRCLSGTSTNCAGGRTPWHTWLSCEEIDRGRVWECDPWGEHEPIVRPALGVFKHEAAAVDHDRAHVYLTEDVSDGRLYRFVPNRMTPEGHPDLNDGTLEVAAVDTSGNVTWHALPDPQYTGDTPTRRQIPESTPFDGGEGIWYHEGTIHFTTKGTNQVWKYDVEAATIEVIYDASSHATPPLVGVDNVTVACCGTVIVSEDGGAGHVVAILPSGEVKPLLQLVVSDGSVPELTGPAFDPSGTRLYFSSQRSLAEGSFVGGGTTFEVTGPFHEPA